MPIRSSTDLLEPNPPSLAELAAAQADGRSSAEALVRHGLARIAALDAAGPRFNAVVALAPDALEQARALDDERRRQGPRSPLHGLPFLVKDNIDVQGLPTTAGSAALRSAVAARDAEAVRRLRAAGALPLGKTNLSEFASSNGRYGYGSLAGTTRNPHHPDHHAAGSSTGSAVAVAAGFAAFALGTDSFGSVRAPASATATAGLRPTLGRVPVDGVLPLALPFDTVGPIARHAADLALVQAVLEGRPVPAPTLAPTPAATPGAGAGALRGARIGVLRAFCEVHPAVRGVMEEALDTLAAAGATLVDVTLPPALWQVLDTVLRPRAALAFRAPLEAYLAALPAHLPPDVPRSLAALVAACEAPAIAQSATPVNPRTLAQLRMALQPAPAPDAATLAGLAAREAAVRTQVLALLAGPGVDALAFPTLLAPPGLRHDLASDLPEAPPGTPLPYTACYLAPAAGCPELSVPAGFTPEGLPVGLSLLGVPDSDGALLQLAQAFEAARHGAAHYTR